MTQRQQARFEGFAVTHSNPADIVMTDRVVARKIVEHFRPRGTVLDPCRGGGAFFDEMPGADWCEVRDGRDFFEWNTRVDWIVSNPPFSIFFEWLRHSMSLADDIVYLIPLGKVWQSNRVLRMVHEWGGIREILIVGNGRKELGFPVGFAVGAVHFQRGYRGDMRNGFLPSNAELMGGPAVSSPERPA
jgi:hypothetical protein